MKPHAVHKEPCRDLREFIQRLEQAHELKRVTTSVDRDLEITEITDRISKRNGPALLFESVKGFQMPVLINAFGSERRMAIACNVSSIESFATDLEDFLDIQKKQSLRQKVQMIPNLLRVGGASPKLVRQAPCQEVVLKSPDLNKIPILKCWPKDGGRFITLPTVITKDPLTGTRNVGVYRMQVYDQASTGMHWQTQKDGAVHAQKRRAANERMPVAVVLGADPVTVFSGIAPLPYGVDELVLSGYIRRRGVRLVRCKTVDLEVPAEAEIVLEGTVDPKALKPEGPFGDHTGVYTPIELFPTFQVQCMTMRKNPIYLTTIVGKPPMEDYFMGKAVERMFLPLLKKQMPELVDMNFPKEGTFNNAVIVSIDKCYPHQARKIAHAIWGLGQLAYTKVVIVVDKHVSVHDLNAVALMVFNNIDPKRDVFFVEGPVDTLNHASPQRDFGSKMGIDATTKLKEEGYTRVWPDEIEMDAATQSRVDEKWASYGLDRT